MSVTKQMQDQTITEENITTLVKELYRECERGHIPMFLAYYMDGYKYKAILPNELPNNGEIKPEDDKFLDFLRVIKGYDKQDYFPTIQGPKE